MIMIKEDIISKIRTVKAYAVKDLKNTFRFKLAIFNFILAPFLTMFSFLITYSAVFFGAKTDDLGFVQKENYVIYLLTGFLVYSCFRLAWGRTNLIGEKVMQTLDGMLLAPSSRLYILMGKAVQSFVEIFIVVFAFVVMVFLLQPPTIYWKNLIIGSVAVIFVFIIFLSLDFIVTAIGLAQEGIASFITTYVPKGFLLVGCVYYPVDIIPKFARPLVYLNPLYHGVDLFRSGFMQADLRFGLEIPFLYLLILAVVLPIISVFVFEYVLKRWGIRGY